MGQGDCVVARDLALPLRLGVCGVGPVNAALHTGRWLERHGRELAGVVHLGIAGSFDPVRLPVGSAALATEEVWPEYGVAVAGGVEARALGFPLAMLGETPLWERLPLDLDQALSQLDLRGEGLPRAVGCTVAAVTGTPERAAMLRMTHGVDMESMEGFAVALACRQASPAPLPVVELRTISNAVGERDRQRWDIRAALEALGVTLPRLLGLAPRDEAG